MAKIKVHELAKELDKQSKDILSFLQEKGIEAKAANSSIEEDAAQMVRKAFGTVKQSSQKEEKVEAVKEAKADKGKKAEPEKEPVKEDKIGRAHV